MCVCVCVCRWECKAKKIKNKNDIGTWTHSHSHSYTHIPTHNFLDVFWAVLEDLDMEDAQSAPQRPRSNSASAALAEHRANSAMGHSYNSSSTHTQKEGGVGGVGEPLSLSSGMRGVGSPVPMVDVEAGQVGGGAKK
jgi:hypothetical protein